jgi:Tol biopolymer transport system component
MPLPEPITRLNAALSGRYSIEREIGEGGMATVYLADDLRHERKVALKVLKPELAALVGADRFLAEIKTTAGLQHPHILPLHDSGEADGFLFFVMPYIEGETLRDRIDREKQLPVDEALGIATAIANALQTAHEAGVVHRDIKPGNILLSRGEALVADFGIALAVGAAGGGRLTETGLSVGTPYYMSPEQATGDQQVGPASDTFALACVLYEMLVGEPPYPGNTAQAVLGKIIQGAPVSATAVRKSIPANVDSAIRRALERLPADRFTNAHGFAKALADPGFRHGEEAAAPARASTGLKHVAIAGWATAVAALAGLITLLMPSTPEPVRRVERFAVPFATGQELTFIASLGFDLSPDGTMLVYRHVVDGQQILMVRRWDDLTAMPVRESVGGASPAVSYDGLQLAFEQDGQIMVAAFSGGPVVAVASGDHPEWGPDGYVYATADSGVVRVSSTGGAIQYVSRLADGDQEQRLYDVLPGGRRALLDVSGPGGGSEIRGLDLESGEMTALLAGNSPRYLPSGHLVYDAGEGTMMAARFDPERMELLGTPVAVMDGLTFWSLADDGKLFYTGSPGGESQLGQGPTLQLNWVTRSGQAAPVDPSWTFSRGVDAYQQWRISPDGSRVAVREFTPSGYDIWIKQLDSGPHSRLTFDGHDKMPVWEPGGERVTFLSDRNGNFDVWSKRADGTGAAELILDLEDDVVRFSWSPEGEWLVVQARDAPDGELLAFRPGVDSVPTAIVPEQAREIEPAISPDGRWIAYVSDETGRLEVFVRPFPDVTSGKWQISTTGGRNPRWAHSGRELFFDGSGQGQPLMVVDVETSTAVFGYGTPVAIDESVGWQGSAQTASVYEVAPDDERFLVALPPRSPGAAPDGEVASGPTVVLVNNFIEELKARVPR